MNETNKKSRDEKGIELYNNLMSDSKNIDEMVYKRMEYLKPLVFQKIMEVDDIELPDDYYDNFKKLLIEQAKKTLELKIIAIGKEVDKLKEYFE